MKINKENVEKMRAAIDIFDAEVENLKILENLYEFDVAKAVSKLWKNKNENEIF